MPFPKWLIKQEGKERGWKCEKCGRAYWQGFLLEAHHVIPSSLGGPDTAENMQLLCMSCHALAHREIQRTAKMSAELIEERLRRTGGRHER